jgi:hypothetical protein
MATNMSHHIYGEQSLDRYSTVGGGEYNEAIGLYVPLYFIHSAPKLPRGARSILLNILQWAFLETACHCFGCHGSAPVRSRRFTCHLTYYGSFELLT